MALTQWDDLGQCSGVQAGSLRTLPLAFLAPDIVASILDGTQPIELTTENLTKRTDLPMAWAGQRILLGNRGPTLVVTLKEYDSREGASAGADHGGPGARDLAVPGLAA